MASLAQSFLPVEPTNFTTDVVNLATLVLLRDLILRLSYPDASPTDDEVASLDEVLAEISARNAAALRHSRPAATAAQLGIAPDIGAALSKHPRTAKSLPAEVHRMACVALVGLSSSMLASDSTDFSTPDLTAIINVWLSDALMDASEQLVFARTMLNSPAILEDRPPSPKPTPRDRLH